MDCSPPGSIGVCPWGLSRQEYWSELPFPPPGDLCDPGFEPTSLGPPALAGGFFPTVPRGKARKLDITCQLKSLKIFFYSRSLLVIYLYIAMCTCQSGGSVVKNPPASAGDAKDAGSIPGSGRSSGAGHTNPLQYCSLENPIDRGASWAVHGVTKFRHD